MKNSRTACRQDVNGYGSPISRSLTSGKLLHAGKAFVTDMPEKRHAAHSDQDADDRAPAVNENIGQLPGAAVDKGLVVFIRGGKKQGDQKRRDPRVPEAGQTAELQGEKESQKAEL